MAQSLTLAKYAQLQQLINRMQSDRSPPATSQHPVILRPSTPRPPTPRPPTPHPLHPTLLPPAPSAPISHSYQRPQEYPTISNRHSALPSLPTLQPFLGFSSLGTSLIGQVNQQRLASSAATQPRQPQFLYVASTEDLLYDLPNSLVLQDLRIVYPTLPVNLLSN